MSKIALEERSSWVVRKSPACRLHRAYVAQIVDPKTGSGHVGEIEILFHGKKTSRKIVADRKCARMIVHATNQTTICTGRREVDRHW